MRMLLRELERDEKWMEHIVPDYWLVVVVVCCLLLLLLFLHTRTSRIKFMSLGWQDTTPFVNNEKVKELRGSTAGDACCCCCCCYYSSFLSPFSSHITVTLSDRPTHTELNELFFSAFALSLVGFSPACKVRTAVSVVCLFCFVLFCFVLFCCCCCCLFVCFFLSFFLSCFYLFDCLLLLVVDVVIEVGTSTHEIEKRKATTHWY